MDGARLRRPGGAPVPPRRAIVLRPGAPLGRSQTRALATAGRPAHRPTTDEPQEVPLKQEVQKILKDGYQSWLKTLPGEAPANHVSVQVDATPADVPGDLGTNFALS